MRRQGIEQGMFLRERSGAAPRGALVWVHGLGESGLCFEALVERQELAGFRHLIPDLPGYGRSVWPEEAPSLEEVAEALARWLEAREEGPVGVIGHSMGGVVGLLLAERHPERVAAFANVEGNVTETECAFSGPAAEQSLEGFVDGGFDALREEVYRDGEGSRALRGYYASLRFADPRVFHNHSRELVALARDERLATRQRMLPVPHLYLAGRPGGVGGRSLSLVESAGVDTRVVSPAGHWPFIDHPASCARLLGEFFAAVFESA